MPIFGIAALSSLRRQYPQDLNAASPSRRFDCAATAPPPSRPDRFLQQFSAEYHVSGCLSRVAVLVVRRSWRCLRLARRRARKTSRRRYQPARLKPARHPAACSAAAPAQSTPAVDACAALPTTPLTPAKRTASTSCRRTDVRAPIQSKPAARGRARVATADACRRYRRPNSSSRTATSFDQARSNLYTTIGTTSDTISHDTIEALPQGSNAPVEKVLLQAPGVSQDSAASGSIHIRNDHANVQFRINGVMLPDGVTGFGSVLGYRIDRQHLAGHRRAAGRIRACARSAWSTSRRAPTSSTIPAASAFTAAAAARSRRASNMAARSAAIVPATAAPGSRTPAGSTRIVSRRAIFFHRQLSADHRRHRKSAADAQRDSRFLAAGKRLCLYVDLRRPLYAPEPDRRNRDQQFPDSRCRPTRRSFRASACPVFGAHFQFSAAQRKPISRTPSSACWRCSDRSTASTGNCPISPATTICTSCPIRSATCC